MKKLVYLFVAATIFIFTACGGEETASEPAEVIQTLCADNCQKACCLGCKATEGEKKCIFLEDGSMPCCL